MTLRDHALNLLARREHGRAELARKLRTHGEAEAIDGLLDELEQEGLLSTARYVEMFAHARAGKHGSLRLKAELRQKGVPDYDMADALDTARTQDLASARQVWDRKFGEVANDAAGRAKQYRFLASRGFPNEVIKQVLGGLSEED